MEPFTHGLTVSAAKAGTHVHLTEGKQFVHLESP